MSPSSQLRDIASAADVPRVLAARALAACNAMLNVINAGNRATFARARAIIRGVLGGPVPVTTDVVVDRGVPLSTDTIDYGIDLHPVVWAVGHCHIDTVSFIRHRIIVLYCASICV